MWSTIPCSKSLPIPLGVLPGPFAGCPSASPPSLPITVRCLTPFLTSASISISGEPVPRNPETIIVIPSSIPATASSAVITLLIDISKSPFFIMFTLNIIAQNQPQFNEVHGLWPIFAFYFVMKIIRLYQSYN